MSDRALTIRIIVSMAFAMPAAVIVYRWINWELDGLGHQMPLPLGFLAAFVLAGAVRTLWRTLAPPE